MTTKAIAKQEMCIYMRNGIEIWLDIDKASAFGKDLTNGMKAMVQIEGRFLNTVDIVGIFNPSDLEDLKMRKQGMWKCKKNNWHAKDEVGCTCTREKEWDERGFYKI